MQDALGEVAFGAEPISSLAFTPMSNDLATTKNEAFVGGFVDHINKFVPVGDGYCSPGLTEPAIIVFTPTCSALLVLFGIDARVQRNALDTNPSPSSTSPPLLFANI